MLSLSPHLHVLQQLLTLQHEAGRDDHARQRLRVHERGVQRQRAAHAEAAEQDALRRDAARAFSVDECVN